MYSWAELQKCSFRKRSERRSLESGQSSSYMSGLSESHWKLRLFTQMQDCGEADPYLSISEVFQRRPLLQHYEICSLHEHYCGWNWCCLNPLHKYWRSPKGIDLSFEKEWCWTARRRKYSGCGCSLCCSLRQSLINKVRERFRKQQKEQWLSEG